MIYTYCIVFLYWAALSIEFGIIGNNDIGLWTRTFFIGIVPWSLTMFTISFILPIISIKLADFPVVSSEADYDSVPVDKDD